MGRYYYTAVVAQTSLLPFSARSLILHPSAEKTVVNYLPFLETLNICKMNWALFATLLPAPLDQGT